MATALQMENLGRFVWNSADLVVANPGEVTGLEKELIQWLALDILTLSDAGIPGNIAQVFLCDVDAMLGWEKLNQTTCQWLSARLS